MSDMTENTHWPERPVVTGRLARVQTLLPTQSVMHGGTGSRWELTKTLASIMAVLAYWLQQMPDGMRVAGKVAIMAIVVDTIAGCLCAMYCREMKSRSIVSKLCVKLTQYMILVAIASFAGLFVKDFLPVTLTFGVIVAREVVSLLEILYKLQKCGGVDLGDSVVMRFASRVLGVDEAKVSQIHDSNASPAVTQPPKGT